MLFACSRPAPGKDLGRKAALVLAQLGSPLPGGFGNG